MLAEFEPDGTVLYLRMRTDRSDLDQLQTQELTGELRRYYTGQSLGDKVVVLQRGEVVHERGWDATWEPQTAEYWTKAHTLRVTISDHVYQTLRETGECVLRPVWNN